MPNIVVICMHYSDHQCAYPPSCGRGYQTAGTSAQLVDALLRALQQLDMPEGKESPLS